MKKFDENTLKNENHYDEIYSRVDIESIIKKVNNIENFINDATKTDTSWVGLYFGYFQNQLIDKTVLELGCGDCLNAAVMAKLGAKVYANDISQKSGDIIKALNSKCNFQFPIQFIDGDFLDATVNCDYFDIVIGKAFVHHLTEEQELEFTEKIVTVLKPNGIVRYFEPAVNSKFLDFLRWLTPMPGRPSIIQRKKFKIWKQNDPHPERDNSSNHYKIIGSKYFEYTMIVPIGTIERFCRFIPSRFNRPLRRFSFKVEKWLPNYMNLLLARSQLIEYKNPKKGNLF